ncbi:MAG: hypothetical protein ACXWM7_07305, partial [Parachlamydiaceae bacterium]
MRTKSIGITKSVYHPIVVPQVIDECFQQVIDTGKVILDPFEQAFFLMVHLPYLQPFEHVNTRVSRLTANIPLIRGNLCPLSFVNVPQKVYINGLLAIYELNRIEILRDVFEWAYERSCALDLLHNWFWLLKLSFLASLLLNFSTISLDMLLKFINKSAQKILIFPS